MKTYRVKFCFYLKSLKIRTSLFCNFNQFNFLTLELYEFSFFNQILLKLFMVLNPFHDSI